MTDERLERDEIKKYTPWCVCVFFSRHREINAHDRLNQREIAFNGNWREQWVLWPKKAKKKIPTHAITRGTKWV